MFTLRDKKPLWIYFASFFMFLCGTSFQTADHIQTYYNVKNYFHWISPYVGSDVLYCPNCCKIQAMTIGNCFPSYMVFVTDIEICCSYRAVPFWSSDEFQHVKGHLYVNYTSNKGTANIVKQDISDYYDLVHINGSLSSFPSNICNFSNLVEINLSMNKISVMPDLSCLKMLDTLKMLGNEVDRIQTSSFANLKNLRIVNFENNKILSVEPGSFSFYPRSLMVINFKNNFIGSLDVKDLILKSYFELLDLSNNRISDITNTLNSTFGEDVIIGGGAISLKNNSLKHFPDLGMMGFPNETALKYAFRYNIDMRLNKWACDCYMWSQYLRKAEQAIPFFLEVGLPTCFSPPHLKGLNIAHFRMKDKTADLLICNITAKDKCPKDCYCFKQPSQRRVVVNCSSTSRLNMPLYAPTSDDLDIDLSHNTISHFAYHTYLNQTFRINLSYNRILIIDQSIYNIQKLTLIDLRHNDLDAIHESVHLKSPCSVLFGEIEIHCKCEMQWLVIWLEKGKVQNCSQNNVICITENEYVEVSSMADHDMCKTDTGKTNYVLFGLFSSILFILLNFMFIYLTFRVEIYLLFRRTRDIVQTPIVRYSCTHSNDIVYIDTKGDFESSAAYISFDESNEDIIKWVINVLLRHLENNHYKVYIPSRDFDIGGIHEESIQSKVRKSQFYIVILSDNYLKAHFTCIEWREIFNMFKSDNTKKIIIINYDLIESSSVQNKNMRAFLRLGYFLDFTNMEKKLIKSIVRRLSHPTHNRA